MSGPVVVLRPLLADDAEVLAGWGEDPEFCRAAGWSQRPFAERRAVLVAQAEAPRAGLLRLAAEHDGVLVGYADLRGEDPACRELGYLVGPRERWGHGLGLAVARAGVRYGFDGLGLTEVRAEVDDANVASVRILRRLGFEENAVPEPDGLRRFVIHRGPEEAP